MNTATQSAQDDLAFMRSVIQPGDGWLRPFGQTYLAAGVCYGVQMLLTAGQFSGWLAAGPPWGISVGLGPTIVFLGALAWIQWRARKAGPSGAIGRATGFVFGCVGVANLVLAAAIGIVALQHHSVVTWLIYPCAVMVMQGAAWLVVFFLRKRAWLALVAAGWFVTAIAMALSVDRLAAYVLYAGLGFLLCMVVPGAVMLRLSDKRA